jgi:thioester reductase-like protein
MNTPEETFLLTGFTGFLGERLTAELLATRPEARLLALVRPASLERARARAHALDAGSRLELVAGDLTLEGLGMDRAEGFLGRVREIYHLAALYDLTCTAAAAELANLRGTTNLLAFAARCPGLRRLHHVSTCYVAGDHQGRFGEDDLDLGQGFLNHYDRTKFQAELSVRRYPGPGATTIYRPAIVVGDSRTGAFAKPDGPYLVMEAMRRLPRRFLFTRVGTGQRPVNLVPIDFVVRGLAHLGALPETAGHCYHLADRDPLSAGELQVRLMRLLDRRFLLLPLPAGLVRRVLRCRPAARLLGLPAEVVPYFDYPAWFDTQRAQAALAGSGITCPRIADYLPTLVKAWQTRRAGTRLRA